MTKPLGSEERTTLMRGAMRRILLAEKTSKVGGVSKIRSKIVTALAAQVDNDLKQVVITHLFDDFVQRSDLAFSWLFEEFCFYQVRRQLKKVNSIWCKKICSKSRKVKFMHF